MSGAELAVQYVDKTSPQDEVVKLSTSHPSRLLLLLLTATLGLTAILSAVALLIFIRRRTQQKTKDLQEEASEDNKEEPVKEYKVCFELHIKV